MAVKQPTLKVTHVFEPAQSAVQLSVALWLVRFPFTVIHVTVGVMHYTGTVTRIVAPVTYRVRA